MGLSSRTRRCASLSARTNWSSGRARPGFGTAVMIVSAASQPAGMRMPRPASTSGNRSPSKVKSSRKASRVIGSVPSNVCRCTHARA